MRRIWNKKIIITFLIITLFLSFSMETTALNTVAYDCDLQTKEIYADFVFKHKTLFITTQTVERSLTLTCDPNGNLS